MARSRTLCSHHILCVGEKSIPYARLSAMCIAHHCPKRFRKDLRIFIHLDGLRVDVEEVARWLEQVPCTEVTMGLFGIQPSEQVSGRCHQTMVNIVAQQFEKEEVIAFVDADCYLLDGSWHKVTLRHDSARDYSLVCGFKGDPIAVRRWGKIRRMRTTLFTLQPGLHKQVGHQKDNKDRNDYEKLASEFPDVHFPQLRSMDCMLTPALRAELMGYGVKSIRRRVKFLHVGGFAYMHENKLSKVTRNQWLVRLRLNVRVLSFFEQLGWERWIDPGYRETIDAMIKRVESDSEFNFSKLMKTLPASLDEKRFLNRLEPLASAFRQMG